MNCETCAETFTSWNDLRQHATGKKHRNQTTHHFSCLPCSLPLHNIPDVIQHVDSEEHYVLSVASDNPFDTMQDDSHSESFPPLYFCMLCSCRDGNPYGIHLKSVVHKNIARLMRAIFSEKTIHYTNDACDEQLFDKLKNPNGPVCCELCNTWSSNWYNYKTHLKSPVHMRTQEFMNKLINVKQNLEDSHVCDDICSSFPFACELCNLHFSSREYYKYHLENQAHKRVELFNTKIADVVKKMDVIIRSADLEISDTFSNSLPPLYYCELCGLWCFKSLGYVQHKKGFIHKRIEELFSKLSDKRKGNVIRLRLAKQNPSYFSSKHCCKLCIIGFSDVKDYSLHLKDKGHLRIEHFIHSLTNEGDINLINIYIDAQIQVLFNNCTPPNYCKVCNILHSSPEKYNQHLQSEEHKQIEQSLHKKNNAIDDCYGRNAPKKLKTSPLLPYNQVLDNVQSNRVKNNSHYYLMNGVNQKNGPLMSNTAFGFESHATYSNHPPWFGFAPRETYSNYPPWVGYQYHAPHGYYPPWPAFQERVATRNYPPWPDFQERVPNGNYPPWPDFQERVPTRNYPPWPGFEAGVNNSNYPPWPGYATNIHNPPWPGFETHENNNIQPTGFNFETRESNNIRPPGHGLESCESNSIFPPGTEVLESNSNCPQQVYEDSSSPQLASKAPDTCDNLSPNEYNCELCDFVCSNSRRYDKHLKGEKHKKLRKLLNKKDKKVSLETPKYDASSHPMQYNCELCDVFNRTAQQYELHLTTAKHKKNQWLLYVLIQRTL